MGIRGPMPKASSLHIDPEQDAPLLKLFDAWVEIADRASAEVAAADALVHVTPKGHQQRNPQLAVFAEATKQVLALAAQLGRTPAARVRLGADTEQEPDDEELDLPPLPKRGPRAAAKA